MRFALTEDNLLAVGSETGMCPLDGEKVIRRGRVGPGGMIVVDVREGKFYEHREIIAVFERRLLICAIPVPDESACSRSVISS